MNHDVIIAGAGMVGGTLACLLAQSGLRTALVEPRPRSAAPPKAYDLRVSAIGIGARRVLGAAGVWPLLDHARLGAFREMHVWDTAGRGSVHFDAAEIGQAQLGWIVENARLVDAIERRLEALGSVAWYRPASVDNLEVDERWATVSMEQARARAALVVAADGSRSRLRDVAGIAVREHAYGQQAVVATVEVSMSHRDTAWQRFLPHGPVAFLPLAGNHCSIVWSTTPERAEQLLELSPQGFGHALEQACEGRLGEVRLDGERAAFALRSLRAREYVRARLALIGDAAHTIHPLAGQGVNLGLLDAAALAEQVLGQAAKGRDFGRAHNLRPYERARKAHNVMTDEVMSGFDRLFRAPLAPVAWLRSAGFTAADRIPALKRLLMRHASGLLGDMPATARSGVAPPPVNRATR